eukprot:scaffold873_cov252-Pinguiococcus_pyrenoidosus.AAC.16
MQASCFTRLAAGNACCRASHPLHSIHAHISRAEIHTCVQPGGVEEDHAANVRCVEITDAEGAAPPLICSSRPPGVWAARGRLPPATLLTRCLLDWRRRLRESGPRTKGRASLPLRSPGLARTSDG